MKRDTQAGSQRPVPPAITKPRHASVGMTGELIPPFMPGRPPAAFAAAAGPGTPAAHDGARTAGSEWDTNDEWDSQNERDEHDGLDDEADDQSDMDKPSRFPLDAFFVPPGADHAPSGYDENEQREMAHRVGAILEAMARRIRERGIGALAEPGADDLSRSVAEAVADFYSRQD